MSISRRIGLFVVDQLLKHAQGCRVIPGRRELDKYLTRYYLNRHGVTAEGMEPQVRQTGYGLYLHQFHRGDDDRELHSHPWAWAVSLVLVGGYKEERRIGNIVIPRIVRPWTLNFLRGDDFHRVDLLDGEAWTLFVVGPVIQSWGFWNRVTKKYTPWREFLAKRQAELS